MPENISKDKVEAMKMFGANVILQPCVPYSNPNHFLRTAERISKEISNSLWTNQFDNEANFNAHYFGTGPEIWRQTDGKIDAFVCAAGTGGTISGISAFLKEVSKNHVKIFLIDPPGSGLYNYIKTGSILPSEGSTITEGIGISLLTKNFTKAKIDDAIQANNKETLRMVYYLLEKEGLYVGPSAAINVVGAVKVAEKLGPGKVIVTVLCDTGDRYKSTIFNDEYLGKMGLQRSN